MQVKRSFTMPENGSAIDWSEREAEVSGLSELASAVAAFGSKVPPGATTVWRWQELSTVALVALVQAGHREAFDPLHRRYAAKILRYAIRLVNGRRDLGEDIAAETWATALADIDRFDASSGDEHGFVRWLHGITKCSSLRRCAFPHLVKERPYDTTDPKFADTVSGSLWEVDDADAGDTATRAQMRRWIREVIESLPKAAQRVAWLKLDGLSAADIAAQLGCSESMVANHWYRFCERCKGSAWACPVQVARRELDDDPVKLRAAAMELSPAARRVVLMRLDGLNCHEIAAQLGRSLGGVQNYCYQARKTFAAQGLAFC